MPTLTEIKKHYVDRSGYPLSAKATITDVISQSQSGESMEVIYRAPCHRCNGTGNVGIYWVEAGVCFRCGGKRMSEYRTRLYTPDKVVSLDAAKTKAAARKIAKATATVEAWLSEEGRRQVMERAAAIVREDAGGAGYILRGAVAQVYAEGVRHTIRDSRVEDVVAAIAEFDRRVAERVARAERDAQSEWVGALGDRIEFTATCIATKSGEGSYGYWFFYALSDADGNTLIHLGSPLDEVDRGDTITMRATIKEHSDRDGVKQTRIQRPSVIEVIKKED